LKNFWQDISSKLNSSIDKTNTDNEQGKLKNASEVNQTTQIISNKIPFKNDYSKIKISTYLKNKLITKKKSSFLKQLKNKTSIINRKKTKKAYSKTNDDISKDKIKHGQKNFNQLDHQKKINFNDKQLEFDQLEYKCRASKNLEKHKRIDSKERSFKCNQCEKKFSLLGNLKTHKRIHSDERPFKCDQCDYKCRISSSLTRHRRIHSKERSF